jgi:hypothetical protein
VEDSSEEASLPTPDEATGSENGAATLGARPHLKVFGQPFPLNRSPSHILSRLTSFSDAKRPNDRLWSIF